MTWLWITLGAIGGAIVLGALVTFFLTILIYRGLLVRDTPDKWSYEAPLPDDAEYAAMFEEGAKWAEKYAECRREVSVESDGLRLAGEYFDFGAERAVIIIPGRTETLKYSYYFAEPFRAAGCGVLVVDNRAHGLSEGDRSSLGFREYRDVLAWCRLLHDELGVKRVTLHGICIGASTALFAAVSPECPDYVDSLSVEGMYPTFYISFMNHMKYEQSDKPRYPFGIWTMFWIRTLTGARPVTDGPIKRIGRLEKPILMLHSREDLFSPPANAEQMYEKCKAPKKLVWFEHGAHSRVRINNVESYDAAIGEFVRGL